jgi:hypothetical protein
MRLLSYMARRQLTNIQQCLAIWYPYTYILFLLKLVRTLACVSDVRQRLHPKDHAFQGGPDLCLCALCDSWVAAMLIKGKPVVCLSVFCNSWIAAMKAV